MELAKIKQWMGRTGGTYVVVEDEEPRFVILDIKTYERLIGGLSSDTEINQEIDTMNKQARSDSAPTPEDIINGLR